MISQLSKVDVLGDFSLFGSKNDDNENSGKGPFTIDPMKKVFIRGDYVILKGADMGNCGSGGGNRSNNNMDVKQMTWSMSECDYSETVEVPVPIGIIQSQGLTGSDVAITWDGGVILRRGDS